MVVTANSIFFRTFFKKTSKNHSKNDDAKEAFTKSDLKNKSMQHLL